MADERDTTLRIVAGQRRQDEALALRLARKRYGEIAHQLGYTDRAAAHRAVTLAIGRSADGRRDEIDEPHQRGPHAGRRSWTAARISSPVPPPSPSGTSYSTTRTRWASAGSSSGALTLGVAFDLTGGLGDRLAVPGAPDRWVDQHGEVGAVGQAGVSAGTTWARLAIWGWLTRKTSAHRHDRAGHAQPAADEDLASASAGDDPDEFLL